jgi:hypothetical protein
MYRYASVGVQLDHLLAGEAAALWTRKSVTRNTKETAFTEKNSQVQQKNRQAKGK